MIEFSPVLQEYLRRLAGRQPAYLPAQSGFQAMPEPGQTTRRVITGPRGSGKTTALLALAAQAAREIVACFPAPEGMGSPLDDVLLSVAEMPLYVDLRQWGGSLLDLAAAAIRPDNVAAGRAHAQDVLNGPTLVLLDHVESLPAGCSEVLGVQLEQYAPPQRASVWAAWRALPGRTWPGWLEGWPTITLGDWSDTQLLRAIRMAFEPGEEMAANVARWLIGDEAAWRAAHRPLYFQAILGALGACAPDWPTRAGLAMRALGVLLDLDQEILDLDQEILDWDQEILDWDQESAVHDWLEHAGFGVCRLAWMILDASSLEAKDAVRVMQESGGVTLDALITAGVLVRSGAQVKFDQPLIAHLCAAWDARARPDRFGGGEQALIGRTGRARALHHALDIAEEPAALLHAALDISAPVEMFNAAAAWLAAAPPERARGILLALAQQLAPDAMIVLAGALKQSARASGAAPDARLDHYAAELARSSLRPGQHHLAYPYQVWLPGPAAPASWPVLRQASSHTLRAALEDVAGRPDAALHSARSAMAASAAAAAWTAHEFGLELERQGDALTEQATSALEAFEQAITLQPQEPAHHLCAGQALLGLGRAANALDYMQRALALAPHDGRIYLAMAEAHTHSGHIEQARRCAEQAGPLLPMDAGVWRRLGHVWAALDEPARALDAWRRGINALPGSPGNPAAQASECYVELGQIHLEQCQVTQASDACQNALTFCPDNVLAHRVLGEACLCLSWQDGGYLGGSAVEAVRHLEIAAQDQPDDAALDLLCAEAMARAGQEQVAVSLFERVLNQRPGDLRAAVSLARLYAEHERPADAQAILDWALTRQSHYPPALAVKGLLAEKQSQFEQAIRLYAQALEGAPEDVALRLPRARLCRQQGRLEEADGELEQVLAAHPNHPAALLELARVRLAQARPSSAFECLRQIKAGQQNAEALCLWAQACADDGKPGAALRVWAQAARRYPSHAAAFEGLGWVLNQLGQCASIDGDGDGDDISLPQLMRQDGRHLAVLAYKHVILLEPARALAYSALGHLYRDLGRTEESVAILTEAVQLLPEDTACRAELGQSLAHLNRWQEAEEQFARAAALEPDSSLHWRWHGGALRRLGRFGPARQALEHALELARGDTSAIHVELAWLYRDMGDAPRALAEAERAGDAATRAADILALARAAGVLCELGEAARAEALILGAQDGIVSQHSAVLQLELGRARLAQGRLDLAQAAFEHAVRLEPRRGEYHAALAGILDRLGQWEAAARRWEQARALGHETVELLQAQGRALQNLGRHAEALALYERLIDLRPRDADAYLSAARAAHRLGRAERALELASWATSLKADLVPAYVLMGNVFLEQGKRASQAPHERRVLLGLAQAALESGHPEPALQAAQAMLELDGDDADAYTARGLAYALRSEAAGLGQREWREAIAAFSAALERQPAHPEAAWGLAGALAALGISAECALRELVLDQPAPTLEIDARLAAIQVLPADNHQREGRFLAWGKEITPSYRNVLKAVLASLRGEKVQAANQLKSAGHAPDPSPEILYWMALVLRRAGALRLGWEAARRATQLDPRNAQVIYELGVILESDAGDLALRRARSAFARAAALAPENALYAHALARIHVRLEENGLARQALEAALSKLPDVPAWYVELGQVCADQDDLDASACALEQARRICPGPKVHHLLGQVYARQGRHAAAASELETAIRGSPDQVEWWIELGRLHHENGAGGRALAVYKHALARSPQDAQLALIAAQMAGELDRWQEALHIIEMALVNNPNQAPLQARTGAIHERLGCLEAAGEAYERAALAAPQVASYHLDAGRLALRVGRAEAAARHLENAIRAGCGVCEAFGLLGDAYAAAGRLDEAAQAYQHAATLEPGNAAHHARLARLYRRRNDREQILAHLEVAHSLAPDDVDIIEEMIAMYEERREHRKSLRLYLKLVELRSEADDCFRAGMAYKRLKAYPEALDMFRRATHLSPNHTEALKQVAVVTAIGFFSK